jgi:nitroreductase
LAEVPVLAMFVHDPSALYVTDADLGRHPVVGGASLYPAVQNFLLAARAEGLGGVLTTLVCNRETELRDILKFPTGWGVHAMVPLGYPKGNHGPITRASVEEMTSIDQWKN